MPAIGKTYEATLDPDGRIHVDLPLHAKRPTKVLLTVLSDDQDLDLAKASQTAWAKDWNQPDEDDAWASLQEEK